MNSTYFYDRLLYFRTKIPPTADPYGNWRDEIGFIDGDLQYASFSFKATLPYQSSTWEKGEVSNYPA